LRCNCNSMNKNVTTTFATAVNVTIYMVLSLTGSCCKGEWASCLLSGWTPPPCVAVSHARTRSCCQRASSTAGCRTAARTTEVVRARTDRTCCVEMDGGSLSSSSSLLVERIVMTSTPAARLRGQRLSAVATHRCGVVTSGQWVCVCVCVCGGVTTGQCAWRKAKDKDIWRQVVSTAML